MFAILALLAGAGISLLSCNQVFADSLSLSLTQDHGENDNNVTSTAVNNTSKFAHRTYKFNIDYTGEAGYYIAVNTENGNGGKLINDQYPTFRIGGVGNGATPGTNGTGFGDNTWGYNLSTGTDTTEATLNSKTYQTVPEFSQPMIASKHDVSGDYVLDFAAKFGDDAPSGNYKTNVYLSATMDANQVAAFNGIAKMQQMNDFTCTAADEHQTGRLIDERDNKVYWVTKLKDGNCWMTQNLDYDIPGVTKVINIEQWMNQDAQYYYDPEANQNLYYTGVNGDHARGEACGTASITTDISECIGDGKQLAVVGDEHYRLGNYYSWSAATAGSSFLLNQDDDAGKNVSSSICPAGWKLPSSKDQDGSFQDLLSEYGWENDTTASDSMNNGSGIYSDPLYFVYAGMLDEGRLLFLGSSGRYSSSTVADKTRLRILYLDSRVNPYSYGVRYRGKTVRCVYVPEKPATTYTVTYDINDTSASDTVKQKFATEAPAATSTDGKFITPASISDAWLGYCRYRFTGWATTAAGDVVYTSNTQFTAEDLNTTLYAKWQNTGACS